MQSFKCINRIQVWCYFCNWSCCIHVLHMSTCPYHICLLSHHFGPLGILKSWLRKCWKEETYLVNALNLRIISSLYCVIVQAREILKRTAVGDDAISSTDKHLIHLTLKITSFQSCLHPDDHTIWTKKHTANEVIPRMSSGIVSNRTP